MAYRLTQIITKTGDSGNTGLGDGSRVAKSSLRIHAIGEVDELNAHLGVLLAMAIPEDIQQKLTQIQHQLFDVGSELAVPGWNVITENYLTFLEHSAAAWYENLSPLEEFILPGGSAQAAQVHVVRTVARRAERSVVALRAEDETISLNLQRYLNRLSDVFFILGREMNRRLNVSDVLWQKNHTA
ncbi:cob(I)yrinic acid a,c-diamide adenosyltransferase [Vitreoscilla stercoraria]|uniref:Cobalamin adenosyltransferase n=1 Tax=Vitreoscilla stercoraria TaxID=61 RepID=A0ABY4EAS9_VITST|nr:cob(I)yrinic acid a,c-diamide adenosyltransferase [Vitreoscilla stercoraria]UOO92860.1 cob(I)yrinic acid a,c-diamide adenosyltransferase [Vitreoscilla stercoraria]